ncbi:hypothetical protein [Spiroplasma platyhelix]|uniref:DUF3688 domain-containing protein n=1 Tax=Spiroplasma platyhelix PALS-1 TaxID=1276218 RepID=A0A846TQ83_9MOLU|nr:hypothetical protein [Spiroplasma platyhelix]MBE4704100.1 hypothetical protein [Spiroplasma platyhelix PALS-1]NKE38470.1 hypothetical protein [Spiroplasma platyhelix PALS-1]UJB29358.1 hypothetical protein SPLAT_v1c05940 [Spiroplasma platyhelix PALS-1]
MIKLFSLLTSITLGSTGTISAATYILENNQKNEVPPWINQMIQGNPNEISVGYDHYLLVNKHQDKQDYFQQKDWMDFNQNKNLYLYLPEANSIDEAIQNVVVDDSAKTWTVGIETPITWTKINNTTYTNNRFITQDTSVANIALMENDKFKEIINSNKWDSLTTQEKEMFKQYGSLPSSRQGKSQDWWNTNQWEKNLSTEKNLESSWVKDKNQKFSQLDLYNRWINQSVIGMNVPLSLIEKNSFTLQQTKINHLFLFQSTINQVWNDKNGNLKNIFTPHWGFTLKIINDGNTLFRTPQIINLKNSFKEEVINNYLNQKKYFSFNSQETTKFTNNYLTGYKNYQSLNIHSIFVIISSLLILFLFIFSLNYSSKYLINRRKNTSQELNNEKRKKSI